MVSFLEKTVIIYIYNANPTKQSKKRKNVIQNTHDCLPPPPVVVRHEYGQSQTNPTYMEAACRVSCRICDPKELDLGLPQTFDDNTQSQADAIMTKTKAYMDVVATDDFLRKALPGCKNKHEKCAHWTALGEVS